MRVSKIDQMDAFIWKIVRLLFSYILVDFFFWNVLCHLIDFWNTPFHLIGFWLEWSLYQSRWELDESRWLQPSTAWQTTGNSRVSIFWMLICNRRVSQSRSREVETVGIFLQIFFSVFFSVFFLFIYLFLRSCCTEGESNLFYTANLKGVMFYFSYLPTVEFLSCSKISIMFMMFLSCSILIIYTTA